MIVENNTKWKKKNHFKFIGVSRRKNDRKRDEKARNHTWGAASGAPTPGTWESLQFLSSQTHTCKETNTLQRLGHGRVCNYYLPKHTHAKKPTPMHKGKEKRWKPTATETSKRYGPHLNPLNRLNQSMTPIMSAIYTNLVGSTTHS